jgi:hypothetical protein
VGAKWDKSMLKTFWWEKMGNYGKNGKSNLLLLCKTALA